MSLSKYEGLTEDNKEALSAEGIDTDAALARLQSDADRLSGAAQRTGIPWERLHRWASAAQSREPSSGQGGRPRELLQSNWILATAIAVCTLFAFGFAAGARLTGASNKKEIDTLKSKVVILEADKLTLQEDQLASMLAKVMLETKNDNLKLELRQATDGAEEAENLRRKATDLQKDLDYIIQKIEETLMQSQARTARILQPLRDDPIIALLTNLPDSPQAVLLAVLDNVLSSEDEKDQALLVLGAEANPRVLPYMLKIADESPDSPLEHRKSVASLLDRFAPNPGARMALIHLLNDESEEVQGYAVTSLGQFTRNNDAREALETYLLAEERSWDNRGAAATSLHRIGLLSAEDSLIDGLRIGMAALFKGQGPKKDLVDYVGGIATSLGMLESEQAIEALATLIETSYVPAEARGAAVTSIHLIPASKDSDRAREAIENALESPYTEIRGTAVSTAGELGYASCLPALITILSQDEKSDIRGAAATAVHYVIERNRDSLQESVVKDAARALMSFIEAEPNVRARGSAITSLGIIGDSSATVFLGEILISPIEDPDLRGASATSLYKIGDKAGVQYLKEVLEDETAPEQIVSYVATAVALIGDDAMIDPLLDYILRGANADALRGAGGAVMRLLSPNTAFQKVDRIIGELEGMSEHAKDPVVLGLGLLERDRLVRIVLEIFEDREEADGVRTSAALALARLDDDLSDSALDLLKSTVKNDEESDEVRRVAALVLAEALDEDDWDTFSYTIEDTDIQALGTQANFMAVQLGESQVDAIYERLLGDDG